MAIYRVTTVMRLKIKAIYFYIATSDCVLDEYTRRRLLLATRFDRITAVTYVVTYGSKVKFVAVSQ